MTWDWLVQRTGKYCSICHMEYPEFQTGIFGRMESTPDRIFLQETHSTQEVERQWEREWGGKMLFLHGANNARGVTILVRNGFDYNVDTVKIDSQRRKKFRT